MTWAAGSWEGLSAGGGGGVTADFLLSNRAQLRRALYRLVGTDASDDGLVEHGEAVGEVGNYLVQHGIWLAQRELIRVGFRRWLATEVLSFSSAAANGTRSAPLPDDFLRLAGDDRNSAVYDSRGRPWGGQINPRDKHRASQHAYWIEDGKIFAGPHCAPPTGAYIEYHYRHPALQTDDAATDPLDFPIDWTPMIPAHGALIGMQEGWFARDAEQKSAIMTAVAIWSKKASEWVRTSQEPQKLRVPDAIGSHYFL